jgi:hypothetical protein
MTQPPAPPPLLRRLRRIAQGLACLFAVLSSFIASAQPAPPTTQNKKLIAYGWDWPNTSFVRAHIADMEKRPFDGIVIGISKSADPEYHNSTLGIAAWGRMRIQPSDYEHSIEDLRATKFKKFTDNFIQIEAMPGDVDFFDADWSIVAENFRALARVAKQGGCVGLEFDPEEYGTYHVWTPSAWSEEKQKKHTEAEYIDKARDRGRELMRAVNAEFPNIKILCLFGPSFTHSYLAAGSHRYRLLAPFIDGMCQVATPGSQIIDGFETSYGYRTPISFDKGRETQLASFDTFQHKQDFDRVMRVGFGLWMDNNSGHLGWHPDEPLLNHFQPDTWQTAINSALTRTDEYVWVWHERYDLWSGKDLPDTYMKAQIAGRTAPSPNPINAQSPLPPGEIPHAASIKGHDDATTFADFLASQNLLLDIPNQGWHFKLDPTDKGRDDKWFATDTDTTTWSTIETGKFWEEQGYDYDGLAWYRRTIDLPEIPKNKKITLVVGAADESAWIYLNGEPVGQHDIGEGGWDQRFSIDVTDKLKPGQNTLSIRVLDRVGPGGIWKPIKIFSEK